MLEGEGPHTDGRDGRGGGVIVIGLVLAVLGFVFQSAVLYVLAALVLVGGTWLRARARATHRS